MILLKGSSSGRPRLFARHGVFRLSPFAALLSVLLGVVLFLLFGIYAQSDSGAKGTAEGCLILAVDESENDFSLREILEQGGVEGVISESSQEVPVDDFGSIKMIALESFRDKIEPFDPRDDGYAGKLKSFFVRDGKRFFYLLLDNASAFKTARLQKQVTRLLGEIPFTFTVLGRKGTLVPYFLLLAAALAGTYSFCRAKQRFIYEVPVLLAFGFCGPFAFILAAFLVGIGELLREPLDELAASRRYRRSAFDYAGAGFKGFAERLKPFRLNCLLALFFLLLIAGLSAAGKLPLVPLAAGCGFFLLLSVFASKAEKTGKNRHIPFTPVPLFPFRRRTFSLSPLLLPFCAVSIAAVFLPLVFPFFFPFRGNESPVDPRFIITPDDYYRHVAFQTSFSYLPLGSETGRTGLNSAEYLRYYLGEDGLIAGAAVTGGRGVESPGNGILPDEGLLFPLEKLMRFLIDYSKPVDPVSAGFGETPVSSVGRADAAVFSPPELKEWIPVAIILTASALNLLQPGTRNKKKKTPLFGDKRMAA